MNLKHAFLRLLLGCCLLTNISRAQIQNGNFETTPTGNCAGATSWISNGNVQLTSCCTGTNAGLATWWVDLTGCTSGNANFIEQAVPTIVGRIYILEWDLGRLINFTAAGVDVSVNGAVQGNFVNATPGSAAIPLNWQHFSICFIATQPTTTIRFTGNAPDPNPGVIGLDNVNMTGIDQIFALQVAPDEGCNRFCISLIQATPYPGATASNIQWYVNNALEASGSTTFCRTFPKNVPTQVSVVFSESACGVITRTLQTTITATENCPCDLSSHAQLTTTPIPCYKYQFGIVTDAGYTALSTYWTVDGQLTGGSSPTLSLLNLSAGTHTICANMIGGVTGEGELCCAKQCTVVTIPEQVSEARLIPYCPLAYPYGPWYNPCSDCNGYYEFWNNGQIVGTSASGCISYILSSTSEMRCYDVYPGGIKCLRKTIYFTIQPDPVIGSQSPDEIITLPCMSAANSVAYNINCPGETHYELYGANGFFQQGSAPAVVNLAVGDYTLDCVDYNNCTKNTTIIHVYPQVMTASSCTVFAEMCFQLVDEQSPWYFANFMNNCPDCQQTVLNATQTGPWITQAFIQSSPQGPVRIVSREYYDYVNCKMCTVTFTVANATYTNVSTNGGPCQTVALPPCLQNQTLKMFINGHPENTSTVSGGTSVVLCCNNPYGISNPTYVIYSENDPCCSLIVNLDCGGPLVPKPGDGAGSGTETDGTTGIGSLHIIPNPTASVFRIASGEGFAKYKQVQITDMNGSVLLTRSDVDSETMIDVSELDKGTYFVNVITDSQTVTLKLISVND